MVATALVRIPELLLKLYRPEALATIEEVVGRFSALLDPLQLQWVEWTRSRVLVAKGERELALKSLQSAYDKLIVDEKDARPSAPSRSGTRRLRIDGD